MKWVFVCLMMLNVLYFSWHQLVGASSSVGLEGEASAKVLSQKVETLRLVSEAKPGS